MTGGPRASVSPDSLAALPATAVIAARGYGPVAGMPVYGSRMGAGTSSPQRSNS